MQENQKQIDEELDDLRIEMEHFKQEKERIRAIVGRIGGIPNLNTKMFNIIFLILVVVCLVLSLASEGTLRLAMLELAIAALTAKIIYLMHNQSRVNHFQLWILTSLEWRLNELLKEVRQVKEQGNENQYYPSEEQRSL
jgi:hypothetical protein